jgi:hypothetical protein
MRAAANLDEDSVSAGAFGRAATAAPDEKMAAAAAELDRNSRLFITSA